MDRRDVASWLQGPKQTLEDQGYDFGYKGERLGLPESGPGSVAPLGRRVLALIIDWFACLLVARLLFSGNDQDVSLATLVIFAIMTIVLLSFGGASFGHRIMGLRVVSTNGGAVSIPRAILRTLLLCLVVPAVVWDRDQRGVHDQVANSVVVRVR
jgi:uncharacterized RDD family membrane protein YckC